LYFQKAITGVTISSQRERILPMFITSLFYYFGYYILHKYSAPLFLQHYMLAIFISVLFASIINIGWKISLHMVGIGGIIGLLSAITHLFGIPTNHFLMLAILVAGIIGTSRLYLNEHTSTQIYSGFMMGYVINFGIIVLFNS
jgi:membrane-associated phospholipid phosphatase